MILENKWVDRFTTILLMLVPIVIGLQPQVMAIIPPAYTIIATIFFGFLSQFTAERRAALMAMAGPWMDRITTILLMLVPVIIGLQPQIMASIPIQYTLIATIIFGLLSQFTSEKRAAAVVDDPVSTDP
jgi:hypothetical protein